MKYILFIIGILAFQVRADSYVDALKKRLEFIFRDEKLDTTEVGIQVYSITKSEMLFDINGTKPLSPASTVKLLTGYVALKKLGPDYTYKTEAYADAPVRAGLLKGNLYLKGSGDPSLVTERMYILAANIERSGVRRIQGEIVADDWVFDQIRVNPAQIPTTTDRAYNAPVGGLNFNYNTTTVYFRPTAPGSKPRVYVEPDTGYIRLVNSATCNARGGAYKPVAARVKGSNGDSILISGSIPMGIGEQTTYLNITEPPLYAAWALRYFLKMRGIDISATKIAHRMTPPTAEKVAFVESPPLAEIVMLMNKYSNNFIAETLVKTLGKELKGGPGTTEKGLEVLNEEATRLGLNANGFKVVSGSGLTRENRMSAQHFIKLLSAAYADLDVLPELITSLPIAGKDGTLRSRMKGTSATGRLRGKTGSIDGVSTLVGLVQSKGGELLAFSVLMNDSTQNAGTMKPWQNYFGQALADFNRNTPLSEKPPPLTPEAAAATTE